MKLPAGPAAAIAGGAAALLAATWRWRRLAPGDPEASPETVRPPLRLAPAVYALWHEHLLPLVFAHRGSGTVALVSEHRDGEILVRVLDRLGLGAARGSSTRGGRRGLREMVRAGRDGRPLAFTPDGPRGPARICKPGVVRAAAETGLPVVPLAAAASSYRRLDSWDRFVVPAPFARVYLARGEPLAVPPAVADAWGDEGDGPTDAATVGRWTDRIRASIERERRRCEAAAGGGA